MFVRVILVLAALLAVGLSGCLGESPAPEAFRASGSVGDPGAETAGLGQATAERAGDAFYWNVADAARFASAMPCWAVHELAAENSCVPVDEADADRDRDGLERAPDWLDITMASFSETASELVLQIQPRQVPLSLSDALDADPDATRFVWMVEFAFENATNDWPYRAYVSVSRTDHGPSTDAALGGWCASYPDCGETCNTLGWCALRIEHELYRDEGGFQQEGIRMHVPRVMVPEAAAGERVLYAAASTYRVLDPVDNEDAAASGIWIAAPGTALDGRGVPRPESVQRADVSGAGVWREPLVLDTVDGRPSEPFGGWVQDAVWWEKSRAAPAVHQARMLETETHLEWNILLWPDDELLDPFRFGLALGLPSGHVLEVDVRSDGVVWKTAAGWAEAADGVYHEVAADTWTESRSTLSVSVARADLPPIMAGDRTNLAFLGIFDDPSRTEAPTPVATISWREGDRVDTMFMPVHVFSFTSGA